MICENLIREAQVREPEIVEPNSSIHRCNNSDVLIITKIGHNDAKFVRVRSRCENHRELRTDA